MTLRPIEKSVVAAALWLQRQTTPPLRVVPALTEQFDLSAVQACKAIALARGQTLRRAAE